MAIVHVRSDETDGGIVSHWVELHTVSAEQMRLVVAVASETIHCRVVQIKLCAQTTLLVDVAATS